MSTVPNNSWKVRTTLAAYRIVINDTAGSGFVVYPSNANVLPLGVTQNTVKDTNEGIPVCSFGLAKLTFAETMSTGGLVAARGDGTGMAVPHVDVTAGSYVIGRLVGPNVTQTGTVAEVWVNPFFKSIP